MKNPNNYGSVFKLSGKRRRPWAIRLTTGWTDDGKQIVKYLSYHETRQEAMIALAEYNKNPYNLDKNKITFKEVYELWKKEVLGNITDINLRGFITGYNNLKSLDNMVFKEIKKTHLQELFDTCGKNYPTLQVMRKLLTQLYKTAFEHDIAFKDYSQFVDITRHKDKNPKKIKRKVFTNEEIEKLFYLSVVPDYEYVTSILMLIYTGLRISEFLELKRENVHIDERYIDIVKSKTKSGIRRVPIAKKVLPFFEYWYNKNNDYLFVTVNNSNFKYMNFKNGHFDKLLKKINTTHTIHDTRHSCVSMLANMNVNEMIIKTIVGHSGKDVTTSIYTHYDIENLIEAIDLI